MFEDTKSMFNGLFGKVQAGMCRLTMNGNIAVKTSNGYKTYNLKKDTLTNVTNFCFNIGEDFFFVIPTNKVVPGDIILVDGKPKCVLEVFKKSIKVIDYENSEIREIVPERHVFMGSVYFYGKIVSMLGSNFKTKGLGGIMKMMMMSQMLSGKSTTGNGGIDLSQMMMMSMFMGGNDNPFDGMLDGMSFDGIISDTDDDDDEEGENDCCTCEK